MMTSLDLPNWLQTVHHDGSEKYVSNPYPHVGDTISIKLRLDLNAPVEEIYLRAVPDGEQHFTPMQRVKDKAPCQWWQADLSITEPTIHYRFLIRAKDGLWNYTALGPTAPVPLDNTDFKILASFTPVTWLEKTVFYQIFPDRFANGDPGNDPQPGDFKHHGEDPHTYPWESPPDPEKSFSASFYGGDLAGIEQKLDYLEKLGINALYLNPIFTAPSNHKYDVADYEHVDPHLGGDEALISLRQALTQRGMRYLLDIVPNHCGITHAWFQTAQSNANAPEAKFFYFNRHPDDYASWLGFKVLPKLNYRSRELRRRMYGADDAIFRRWLRPPFSADGWRVDVANMLARHGTDQLRAEVTQEIRAAVKATRSEAYLLGENFLDSTAQLQGDQYDAIMNYSGFSVPLLGWLGHYTEYTPPPNVTTITSPTRWQSAVITETWQLRLASIPWVIARQQFNLLGSHDTVRLCTLLQENQALHRLAALLQFTFPGVPCLYYGDEIGLTEDKHLRSRNCMVWDETRWDHDLLAFYRDLIALRKESIALQRGGFQILLTEPDTLAYQRDSLTERIIVIAHRADTPRPAKPLPVTHGGIADGVQFVEHFTGQRLTVENGILPLPQQPQGATLWQQRKRTE